MVKRWFIKNSDAQVFFLAIRFRHFQEGIHLSYSRDVVWDKWLEFSVKVYFLRLVPLDVLKQILHIVTHLQTCEFCWIVSAWNLFVFVIVIIVFSLFLLL